MTELQLTPRVLPFSQRPEKGRFDLNRAVVETTCLPASIELLPKLLLLLDDADLNGEALADVIAVDPGLTADVVQVANSAWQGATERVEVLTEAVVRLGLQEIFALVSRIVTAPALSSTESFRSQGIDLWRHSLACGVASKIIGREVIGEHGELVFMTGLLHDIGKVVLAKAVGSEYERLLEKCRLSREPLHGEEAAAFRVDHAEIGAKLLERWRFPARVTTAIRHHHQPDWEKGEGGPLAAVLALGNFMAYRIRKNGETPSHVLNPNGTALERLELGVETLFGLEEEIAATFEAERRRFC